MNQEQGLQAWPTPRKSRVTTRAVPPILIQVPELPESLQGQGWTTISARVHGGVQSRVRPRPRRRLRREVRMAGYSMMVVTALAWVPQVFLGRGSALTPRSDAAVINRGRGCAAYAVAPPPALPLSID